MQRPVRVAPTPLFDRLVSVEDLTVPASQLAALDEDGLKASVAVELERVLVSRCRRARETLDLDLRTTIDYGVEDHFILDPRSVDDRKQLAAEITATISNYEPRLSRVSVTVEEPNDIDTRLRIRIDALLSVGHVKEPLTFLVIRRGAFLEVRK
ncbi:MAG: type VI secretion system baseplate subunit TssE [Myxococcales bacterium]|nr:type VI secretion system baseplate subunit TssE [Myxococcales bacterium]